MTGVIQPSLFGRTSPVPSLAIMGATSPPSSIRWANSGRWTSSGECWMLDASESPNDDAECSSLLAWVMEPQVDDRYYLSPKACAGVVLRMKERGKRLPVPLQEALQAVADEVE